jgi:sRNA-binding protein
MPQVDDAVYAEMRRLFRACSTQFRRYERAERAKLNGSPLSIVEAQQVEHDAKMNHDFAEACNQFAAPEDESLTKSSTSG